MATLNFTKNSTWDIAEIDSVGGTWFTYTNNTSNIQTISNISFTSKACGINAPVYYYVNGTQYATYGGGLESFPDVVDLWMYITVKKNGSYVAQSSSSVGYIDADGYDGAYGYDVGTWTADSVRSNANYRACNISFTKSIELSPGDTLTLDGSFDYYIEEGGNKISIVRSDGDMSATATYTESSSSGDEDNPSDPTYIFRASNVPDEAFPFSVTLNSYPDCSFTLDGSTDSYTVQLTDWYDTISAEFSNSEYTFIGWSTSGSDPQTCEATFSYSGSESPEDPDTPSGSTVTLVNLTTDYDVDIYFTSDSPDFINDSGTVTRTYTDTVEYIAWTNTQDWSSGEYYPPDKTNVYYDFGSMSAAKTVTVIIMGSTGNDDIMVYDYDGSSHSFTGNGTFTYIGEGVSDAYGNDFTTGLAATIDKSDPFNVKIIFGDGTVPDLSLHGTITFVRDSESMRPSSITATHWSTGSEVGPVELPIKGATTRYSYGSNYYDGDENLVFPEIDGYTLTATPGNDYYCNEKDVTYRSDKASYVFTLCDERSNPDDHKPSTIYLRVTYADNVTELVPVDIAYDGVYWSGTGYSINPHVPGTMRILQDGAEITPSMVDDSGFNYGDQHTISVSIYTSFPNEYNFFIQQNESIFTQNGYTKSGPYQYIIDPIGYITESAVYIDPSEHDLKECTLSLGDTWIVDSGGNEVEATSVGFKVQSITYTDTETTRTATITWSYSVDVTVTISGYSNNYDVIIEDKDGTSHNYTANGTYTYKGLGAASVQAYDISKSESGTVDISDPLNIKVQFSTSVGGLSGIIRFIGAPNTNVIPSTITCRYFSTGTEGNPVTLNITGSTTEYLYGENMVDGDYALVFPELSGWVLTTNPGNKEYSNVKNATYTYDGLQWIAHTPYVFKNGQWVKYSETDVYTQTNWKPHKWKIYTK